MAPGSWRDGQRHLDLSSSSKAVSADRVGRPRDGLDQEEFVDEGYEASYTDLHVVAAHCYHHLVVIEEGNSREGSNTWSGSRRWYAGQAAT